MRLTAALVALLPATALAHEGAAEAFYRHALLAALVMAALAYALAWRRSRTLRARDAAAFGAGMATLVLASTAVDADATFAAHMIQHELMMVVAPPLIVLGRPVAALAAVAPGTFVRVAASPLRLPPIVAWSAHAVALWLWHAPPLFDAALASPHVHALQHLAFFATALLFWWAVFRRVRAGTAVLYVAATMMHGGALAALLTFTPSPLYAGTPLMDQQLGGLVMWVPAGLVMTIAGLLVFDRLIGERS